MDADLQHPPEDVPKMLSMLISDKNNQFILGTRYGSGEMAVDSSWPLYRQIISKGARALARPLTPLSDPMSGFFGITRAVYNKAIENNANPIGFKIALEIYVKGEVKQHVEHAFLFGVRLHGFSKLTGKVIIHYLRHLYDLYQYKYPFLLHALALVLLFLLVNIVRYLLQLL
jgi:dolichol-phosphate mannosyltransferase